MTQHTNQELETLISKYRGLSIILGIIIFLLVMTQALTFNLLVIFRAVLSLAIIVPITGIMHYDDSIRHWKKPKDQLPDEHSHKSAGIALLGAAAICLTIALFAPGVPLWGHGLLLSFAAVLALQARLKRLAFLGKGYT